MESFQYPRHRIVEWALVCGFLAVIVAPAADQVLGRVPESLAALENRPPALRPELSLDPDELSSYPEEFEEWFNDACGLRDVMLRAHNLMKVEVFGVSPSDRMVLGEGDWLFTTTSKTIENHRGVHPFEPGALERWQRTLEARRDWLESRGIAYYFVLAPNKTEVYSERLPAAYAKQGKSRREEFLEHFSQSSTVEVIDLLPGLLRGKRFDSDENHVYYPLGTHWTMRGAYLGYRQIMEVLSERFEGMESWGRENYSLRRAESPDDLSRSLFLDGHLTQSEQVMDVRRRRQARVPEGEPRCGHFSDMTLEHSNPKLPCAVIFRDSYGMALVPFLAEHFSCIHFFGTSQFSADVVEKIDPDVVIQINVDRYLSHHEPSGQMSLGTDELRERFEASRDVRVPAVRPGMAPELEPYGGTEIVIADGSRPVLRSGTGAGAFLVPELELPDGEHMAVIRLAFKSPANTQTAVYYSLPDDPGYRDRQTYWSLAREGRNELYIAACAPDQVGRLAIRPGTALGDYVIHDLEVRIIER